MVEALKKLDRKFLIIIGCMFLIPIVLLIFLLIVQSCSGGKISYEKYESRMLDAAIKYFKDDLPSEEGEEIIVTLNKLVEDKYIKSPNRSVKDNCTGSVSVRRNGSSIADTNGGFLNYIVKLNCENYSTISLNDKIIGDVVTSESGLYEINGEYVFRGKNVNNYVNFFGHLYRIVSIDKNGIIKLIKNEPESTSKYWDNKFNIDANSSVGKTIYKDSSILSALRSDYLNSKKISKSARAHIVAYDVCIGKRSQDDYTISKEIDCSEKLDKQVISLLSVSDYAMASTDPDCNTTVDRSCRNYNYLSSVAFSTWTLNSISDNSYEALYISDGLQKHQNANLYNEYNIVIYIDGSEAYIDGSGSLNNPYVVK